MGPLPSPKVNYSKLNEPFLKYKFVGIKCHLKPKEIFTWFDTPKFYTLKKEETKSERRMCTQI